MATATQNVGNNPNAVYDNGPNAAGVGRVTNQDVVVTAIPKGLTKDGVLGYGNLRVGFNAAGVSRDLTGPNAAGKPKSYEYPEGHG